MVRERKVRPEDCFPVSNSKWIIGVRRSSVSRGTFGVVQVPETFRGGGEKDSDGRRGVEGVAGGQACVTPKSPEVPWSSSRFQATATTTIV
jgi:hypothetical protein